MAKINFRLDPKLVKRINELASDLSGAAEGFREAWSEESERWQEGSRGMAADTWIEELENVVDTLETVTEKPEGA